MISTIGRTARLLALAASLAIAGSGSALAAADTNTAATNLTISPFIEVSGIAAALNWSSTTTVGGEVRTWNITGDNGVSSYFDIATNTAAGYKFSIGISDLDGSGTQFVSHAAHKAQLTKMRDGTDGSVVALTGLVGLGQYTTYPGPENASWELWRCNGLCVDNIAGAEGYQTKLQLTVPTGLRADTYTGSVAYVAETL